jgi:type II secretory pathway pseudopilin PulG
MEPELLVAISSLVISLASLVVAILSANRSSRISAAQAEVQSRMLALENVRQRAETRAMKRASVRGRLVKYGSGDARLVVCNEGPALAKDVTITLDGAPPAEHPVWLGNVSDDPIQVLGAGSESEFLLALAQQSPDKMSFEVSWENPSGERDSWSTEMRLF